MASGVRGAAFGGVLPLIDGDTGQRYSYIDLADGRVQGRRPSQARLRQRNVPKRSWVLFYISGMAGEWVGVYAQE